MPAVPGIGGWLVAAYEGIALASIALALGSGAAAWIAGLPGRGALLATGMLPALLLSEVAGAALLAMVGLPAAAEGVRFGSSLGLLGALTWLSVAGASDAEPWPEMPLAPSLRPLTKVTAVAVFGLLLVGSAVQASGAAWACIGFPDCNGEGVFPFGETALTDLNLLHRALGYVAVGLAVWLVWAVERESAAPSRLRAATRMLGAGLLLEGVVGATAALTSVPPSLQALHAGLAIVCWSAAIATASFAGAGQRVATTIAQPVRTAAPAVVAQRHGLATTLRAYVVLTKPKVMSLLLVTTVTAMIAAAHEMPPLGLVFWTVLGGALMSGGAGAINHYVDRDIDPLMGRTAARPLPSGIVEPQHALWFGVALGGLAFALLVVLVNPLAAILSLAGFLGYVFVYTLGLKRLTPSNIVIGGAAGALPPLVGWAAVTNDVSLTGLGLTAWYLFAIVFFWTPPHFWALSLLIKDHYARASVPMLPVVRGEAETRWQILLYSLLLVALSLVLVPVKLMGLPYLVVALVLGACFVYLAARLWRTATRKAALQLYLYSLAYLAALFVAMAVDRVLAGPGQF